VINFTDYLQNRDPQLYDEVFLDENLGGALRKVVAPVGLALGGMFGAGDVSAAPVAGDAAQLSEDDILAMVQTTPLEILRMKQKDPAKFEKDLAALKKPANDIGMAIHGKNLNRKIMVAILSDEGMKKYAPGKLGIANPESGWILLSKNAFVKLPTGKTLEGAVLTPEGQETLDHEGRHNTQATDLVPPERSQVTGGPKAYRTDPTELGVRLAAAKNMMSPDYLRGLIAKGSPAGNMQTMMQKLLGYAGDDEKGLFKIIADPKSGAVAVMADPAGKKIFSNVSVGELQKAIEYLGLLMSSENMDVADLLHTLKSLGAVERKKIIDELMMNYDSVVRGDSSVSSSRL